MAFALGGLMALAMPPFNCFPLLWLCLPALILLLRGCAEARQAFVAGWCFAFGFFVFGLYWIAASMFVDLAAFWWAVPLAVCGLPAFFALYYGLAAAISWRIGLRGVAGSLQFALLWFLAEYARGHVVTGFPWNLSGYAWSGVLPVLQITHIIGIYGLTLLTGVAATLPAALFDQPRLARRACAAAAGLFVIFAAGGETRLLTTPPGAVENLRLRIVQPDISQARKWVQAEQQKNFDDLLDLTSAPATTAPDLVIWPETASTFYLAEDAAHRLQIAARLPPQAILLTGVIRHSYQDAGRIGYFNSLVAVDAEGGLRASYDKAHLVPFGEYMPLRRYIPLRTLAASGADFMSGPGLRTLKIDGLPSFSPLICYEAIFPGAVIDDGNRPDFMLNITNDGWYGKTSGPYQHFAIVRVRAIEEGLPLIRAANTGISGVFDPLGRITAQSGLGEKAFIDSVLPQKLPPTCFAVWREYPLWVVFFTFIITFVCIRRRFNSIKSDRQTADSATADDHKNN